MTLPSLSSERWDSIAYRERGVRKVNNLQGLMVTANALSADAVIEGRRVYPFDGRGQVYSALAIRDGKIIALGDVGDLDAFKGGACRVVRDPDLVLLPALHDSHNHMLRTSSDVDAVELKAARSLADVIRLVAARAATVPEGQWIVPSLNWHETNLAERRLPTAVELDRATTRHPVCLRRGGHVVVVNSTGLKVAGINRDTLDPPGSTIVRDEHGEPTGVLLERPAFATVTRLLPAATFADRVDALARTCQAFNARGLGAIRDPGLFAGDLAVYQALHQQGRLTVRSNVMVRLDNAWDQAEKLAELDRWEVSTGFGDDFLRLGGIKLLLDGGVEGAALSRPYANDPSFSGHLALDTDALTEIVARAVERGWSVGCHAAGDVALDMALDAYSRVIAARPSLRRGTLAVEHAFFADAAQRRRAIDLGVAITVQHPLLYFLGGNMVTYWGAERAAEVSPVREWVEEGAMVSAGSDANVTPFDPLLSIWGLVTRGTMVAGRLGERHAVDQATAFELYTVAGATLVGEANRRGSLTPGRFADLVAFRTDPLTCPVDDLPGLSPAFTVVGGRPVYDPEGLFPGGGLRDALN